MALMSYISLIFNTLLAFLVSGTVAAKYMWSRIRRSEESSTTERPNIGALMQKGTTHPERPMRKSSKKNSAKSALKIIDTTSRPVREYLHKFYNSYDPPCDIWVQLSILVILNHSHPTG